MTAMYKRGDIVRVWSLQSFFGGGFLNGERAIVKQDQTHNSVLLIVTRNIDSEYVLDLSYEVYDRQLELVRKATESDSNDIKLFLELYQTIKEWRRNKKDEHTPYDYAKEFYFDENMHIQLDTNKIEYPEMFI